MNAPGRLRGFARAFSTSDAGSSIVELALAAPFLILIALGTIEIGKYQRDALEVSDAAHAAAEYGAQSAALSLDAAGIVAAANGDSDITLAKPTVANAATDIVTFYTCSTDVAQPQAQYAPYSAAVAACPTARIDTFLKVTASGVSTSIVTVPGVPNQLTITKTAIQQVGL